VDGATYKPKEASIAISGKGIAAMPEHPEVDDIDAALVVPIVISDPRPGE
jgi:hypothetical protein